MRRGEEIPEHAAFKGNLRNLPAASKLLDEVGDAEADAKRWNERNVETRLKRLSRITAELRAALAGQVESPTLRAAFGPLYLGRRAKKARRELRWIDAVLRKMLTGPSQSGQQEEFRKTALDRMEKANVAATGQPHWELIRDAVYLASGEDPKLDLSADSYRAEHHRG